MDQVLTISNPPQRKPPNREPFNHTMLFSNRVTHTSRMLKDQEKMKKPLKILFLCTGNSCRSQMAEGWARHLKEHVIDAYSAGIEPRGMDPLAVKVMAESCVDISRQHSKHVDELKDIEFDFVVTVCDNAHEACPLFPGKTKVVHVGFDDPPALARTVKTAEEAMVSYRRVRDEIWAFVEKLPDVLLQDGSVGDVAPPGAGRASPTSGKPLRAARDVAPPGVGRASPPGEPPLVPRRKKLPHAIPSWVKQGERHFVTINCKERLDSPLIANGIAELLLKSGKFYEKTGRWYLWLMLVMPDHVHLIASFDLSAGLRATVSAWKRYQAKRLKIQWQADFFEHRLRNQSEFDEKASYIRMNPVRKKLVERPEQWPYLIDRTMTERGSVGDVAPPGTGRASPPGEPPYTKKKESES